MKLGKGVKEHFVMSSGIGLHLISCNPEQISTLYVGHFAQLKAKLRVIHRPPSMNLQIPLSGQMQITIVSLNAQRQTCEQKLCKKEKRLYDPLSRCQERREVSIFVCW